VPLAPVHHVVRLAFKYEGGGVGKGGTAALFVDEKQVALGSIPQTLPARFSLDETFDVGADLGTPVVEEYADKMPYEFTGTLSELAVVLEPEKLSPEEKAEPGRVGETAGEPSESYDGRALTFVRLKCPLL
jgi:hypothetical protein